jgi:hypothetical protein
MSEPDSRLIEACWRFVAALRKSVDVVDDSDGGRRYQGRSDPRRVSPRVSYSLTEAIGEAGVLIRAAGDEAAALNLTFEAIVCRLRFRADDGEIAYLPMPRIEKTAVDAFEREIRNLEALRAAVLLIWSHTGRRVKVATDDALDRTVHMLKGSSRKIKLVRFLASKPERRASLDEIVVRVHNHQKANWQRTRTARRLAELLRSKLDREDCPLRVEIIDSEVRLFSKDAEFVASCRIVNV